MDLIIKLIIKTAYAIILFIIIMIAYGSCTEMKSMIIIIMS